MKLYRGESAVGWQQRLMKAGWPMLAAEEMAQFLVGDDAQGNAPLWSNLLLADELLRQLNYSNNDAIAQIVVAAKQREEGTQ